MNWIIDTNIAIDLRDGDQMMIDRVAALDGAVLLSVVSRVELEGGVYQIPAESGRRRARLDGLLTVLPVLDFDERCADAYRSIIERAGYSRRKVLDRMIAAQALVANATLITCNGDDFRDVPGLTLIEW